LDFSPPPEGQTDWTARFYGLDGLKPVLIEQGLYSQRTALSNIFCRQGQPEEDSLRNKLVIAWIAKTKSRDGKTETVLDTKTKLTPYFESITIEDTRYDTDCGRYANFNTANTTSLTKICAKLDLTDSNTTIYTKEVVVG
jgi:hypothetical protein